MPLRSTFCANWPAKGLALVSLLAGSLAAQPAAAQSTAWVLLKPDNGGQPHQSVAYQEKEHQPVRVPKQFSRYLLKYVTLGGQQGQPPAQQLNFLIGRTASGDIAFAPANAPGSLVFRKRAVRLFPATPPAADAPPAFFAVPGATQPSLQAMRLFPVLYPGSFTYNDPLEQELYLLIGEKNDRSGMLLVGGQPLTFRVSRAGGLKNAPNFTPALTQVQVVDGQPKQNSHHLGEPFLANGYFITPQYVSPGGDSLRVQLAEAAHAPLPYGNDPGLAFQPATLTDVQGRSQTLAGPERPLVLDFWGTWCGPCVALTPRLKALHQRYAASADIVSVALDEPDKVVSYLKNNAIDWTNIALPDQQPGSFINRMAVMSFPTFVLVYQGKVLYRGTGAQGLTELEQQLAKLP